MKLSKHALVLGVLSISTALGQAYAKGQLLRKKDDSSIKDVVSTSLLMTKIYSIFSSCEGCVETAAPSPQVEVTTHGGNPSSSEDEVSSHDVSPLCGLNHHPSIESVDVHGYSVDRLGCFEDISNVGSIKISEGEDKMAACVASCTDMQRFFALKTVTEDSKKVTSCKCFTDYPYFFKENPSKRLSLGSCECTVGDDDDKMELYVKTKIEQECPDSSLAVDYRDQLVHEDGKALGFDLVTNEYKQSPFLFTKVGCGTNMYYLKTSSSGSSKSMATSKTDLKEATENSRKELSASISTEAEAGYESWWGSVSGKVSGSANQESSKELSASTSQGLDTQRFESFGVMRIASIMMKDITSFVRFNRQFIDRLKEFKNGYDRLKARKLFQEYGILQVRSGLIGGYVSMVTTVKKSTLLDEFKKNDKMKKCYEAAVAGSGEYAGVSGSFSVDASGCSGTDLTKMKKHLQETSEETQSHSYFGGVSKPGNPPEFDVPKNLARFLPDKKLYPEPKDLHGDPLPSFGFLTDYLDPKKIHPVEFRNWGINEDDFQEIKEKLEEEMKIMLQEIGGEFDECKTDCIGGTIYLTQDEDESSGFKCHCYNPRVPILGDCTAAYQCEGNPNTRLCQEGKCRRQTGYVGGECETSDECMMSIIGIRRRCCKVDDHKPDKKFCTNYVSTAYTCLPDKFGSGGNGAQCENSSYCADGYCCDGRSSPKLCRDRESTRLAGWCERDPFYGGITEYRCSANTDCKDPLCCSAAGNKCYHPDSLPGREDSCYSNSASHLSLSPL